MKTIVLIFSIMLAVSCDSDTVTVQATDITFIEIGQGSLNGTEGVLESNLVINNQTDWESLIDQMDAINNTSGGFSETEIDFDNYIVLAVILGVKPTGWEVEINCVKENDDNVLVTTEETEYVSAVISQPFHIVKIPVNDKSVIFE